VPVIQAMTGIRHIVLTKLASVLTDYERPIPEESDLDARLPNAAIFFISRGIQILRASHRVSLIWAFVFLLVNAVEFTTSRSRS
jgi:hypothetical protein